MRTFPIAAAFVAIATTLGAQRGPVADGVLQSRIFNAPSNTPMPPGIGQISGRVLDRESRAPIANATVTIGYLSPFDARIAVRPAIASRTITTDASGEFVARNIALGDYTVYAGAADYSQALRLTMPVDNGKPVLLTQTRPDAAVTINLSRVASLEGVVTSADGRPQPGTPVRIFHHVFVGALLAWQPLPVTAITDQSGRYRFRNAPPGDYIVGVYYRSLSVPASVSGVLWGGPTPDSLIARFAESDVFLTRSPILPVAGEAIDVDGYRWSVHDAHDDVVRPADPSKPFAATNATTYFPDVPAIRDATVIALSGGEVRTGIDIRVRRVNGVRVSGTLVGEPSQIAHVGLRLLPLDSSDVLQTFPSETAATVTDDQGRFAFFGVPAGAVYLDSLITAPLPATLPPDAPLPPRVPSLAVRQLVEVATSDITDLKVPVRPLFSIRGRIAYEPRPNTPLDGRPGPAMITLQPIGPPRGPVSRPPAQAAAQFAFDRLSPGRFMVNATGQANWIVKSITVGGRDVLHRAVELVDADLNDVVVTYTTGANRVTGFVQDKSGLGLEGAQVVIFPADYRAWYLGGRSVLAQRSILAGPRGAYNIAGLGDGEYLIVAFTGEVDRDWQSLAALETIAPFAQKVVLEGGKVVTTDVTEVLKGVTIPARLKSA